MSPRRAGTPCLQPGCPAIVPAGRGRCDEHRKAYNEKINRDRGTPAERGYGPRWARFRLYYLREHPICGCGCGRLAEEIHHLRPVSGPMDPGFFDEDNLVSLTKACHSRETMKMLNEQRRS